MIDRLSGARERIHEECLFRLDHRVAVRVERLGCGEQSRGYVALEDVERKSARAQIIFHDVTEGAGQIVLREWR